jgi:hypothetical protein
VGRYRIALTTVSMLELDMQRNIVKVLFAILISSWVTGARSALAGVATPPMPPPSFYATLPTVGRVAIIDPATNEIRRIAKLPETYNMVASQTRPLLFVVPFNGGGSTQIDFVDTNSIAILGTVTLPAAVGGMTLSNNGDLLYAAAGNAVVLISVQSRSIKATIPLPDVAADVAVVGQGYRLYATLPNLHEFANIDATTKTVIGYVHAGKCLHEGINDPCFPRDIRTSPGGRYAIAVSGRNAIAVDTTTGAILAKPAVEGHIFLDYALAVDPSASELWIEGTAVYHRFLTSMNMLPPFNIISSLDDPRTVAPYSAAFSPSGQGFGGGFGDLQDRVTSFPPSPTGTTLYVADPSGEVVYVP